MHADPKIVEVQKYLSPKDTIFYEDVQKVMQDLSKSSLSEKNFFGRFKSPVTKEWNLLQKLYEQDNLKRAEMAKRL